MLLQVSLFRPVTTPASGIDLTADVRFGWPWYGTNCINSYCETNQNSCSSIISVPQQGHALNAYLYFREAVFNFVNMATFKEVKLAWRYILIIFKRESCTLVLDAIWPNFEASLTRIDPLLSYYFIFCFSKESLAPWSWMRSDQILKQALHVSILLFHMTSFSVFKREYYKLVLGAIRLPLKVAKFRRNPNTYRSSCFMLLHFLF